MITRIRNGVAVIFAAVDISSSSRKIPLKDVIDNCRVVLENLDEAKNIEYINYKCGTINSFVAFHANEDPFFSIGKVISKGITAGLKFDIAGGILREGDKFLEVSKMKAVKHNTSYIQIYL